jgi:hypothetical protein
MHIFQSFGKGEARKLIAEVTVLGSAPSVPTDWDLVDETLLWRADAKKNIAKWKMRLAAP